MDAREPSEGDEINRPEPIHGLNNPRKSAIFTKRLPPLMTIDHSPA